MIKLRFDKITDQFKLDEIIKYTQMKGCRNCGECCSNDTIILDEDIVRIQEKFGKEIDVKKLVIKDEKLSHYYNKPIYLPRKVDNLCIFLEQKDPKRKKYSCRVHDVKPIKCATYSCSNDATSLWFKWNYLMDKNNTGHLMGFLKDLKESKDPFGVSGADYKKLKEIDDVLKP